MASISIFLFWSIFLYVVVIIAKAEVYRVPHHVDAGRTISKKLAHRSIRSMQRRETLMARTKGGAYESNLHAGLSYEANYMMELHMGTPPRKYLVDMDTGSDLLWLQCSPCKECSYPMLDHSQSTSFSSISCHSHECASLEGSCPGHHTKYRYTELKYSLHHDSCVYNYWYADSAGIIGEYIRESTTLLSSSGLTQSSNITMGCAHSLRGLSDMDEISMADGILGLNFKPTSFLSQLHFLDGKFSYYLRHYSEDDDAGGHLFLGGTPPSSSHSIPIIDNPDGFYQVHLQGVTVGNTMISRCNNSSDLSVGNTLISRCNNSLDLSINGTIFDSGSPFTLFNYPVFLAIKDAFIDALPDLPFLEDDSSDYNVCFNISNISNVKVPPFSFQFQGASWHLPVENYVSFDDSQMCLLINPSRIPGIGTIGAIAQQNHLISYDAKRMTISFVKSDCSKL